MEETKNSLLERGKEIDISAEEERTYEYAGGELISILHPLILIVSDNGHRVVDEAGVGHYIAYGWRRIIFKARNSQFQFLCQLAEKKEEK